MAAFAYIFPPVSGAVAFFMGSNRGRVHGLQAAVLGALWPALLYLGSLVSAAVTQAIFVLEIVMWLSLILATAMGRDPVIPWLGAWVTQRS
jgi:hypothetical protein